MKSFVLGIVSGLTAGLVFAGVMSENDDKMIKYEKRKANMWRDKYWEGNRQIALYDDEVRKLKKIINALSEKIK